MLKKSLLPLVAVLTGCATASMQKAPGSQDNKHPEKLTGIWEFKGMKAGDNNPGFTRVQPGQFKLTGGDGAFANFGMMLRGAAMSSKGTWEAISDSVIVEQVNNSIHRGLTGKLDTLYFKLGGRGLLYLKWHRGEDNAGNPADVWIEELWEKIDLPRGAGYPATS